MRGPCSEADTRRLDVAACVSDRLRVLFVAGLRVREQERAARSLRGLTREAGVRACGILNWHDLRNQRSEIEESPRLQIQNALHVPLLRPTHITHRVVETSLLVLDVVASGAVRSGNPERQLLLVERGAREVDRYVADEYQSAAVARHLRGEEQRVVGGGCGSDKHAVDADRRGFENLLGRPVSRGEAVICPAGESVLDPTLVGVDREDLGAGGSQEAARDLADETAPDDGDAVADMDVGEPDAV